MNIILLIKCAFFTLFSNLFIIDLFNSLQKVDISVIIPTHNREQHIINSIKSVLNQSFNNFEIIIIDDCSTDNTQYEIKKIKDNRIKYIKLNKVYGASYSRNLGIKLAKGKFVSFQDSDDIYHFDKLERQMRNIKKYKSDFDFCKILVQINNTNKFFVPNARVEKRIIKDNNIFEILISEGNFISTQSILIKKIYLEKNLFDPKFPRLQDYDLVLRIIPKVKVSYTNISLVDLYRQNDSISLSPTRLKESLNLLLNKNYNLSPSQKIIFFNYINSIINQTNYF